MPDRPPGILSRLTARLGRALYTLAKGGDEGLITPGYILHDVATITPSGAYEVSPTPEGLFKLFVENLWVFSCVSTNAAATAAAPWNLKRWNTETGQGDVVSDHPLIDLLEMPYEGATYETLVQTIDAHLDIAGNAFIEIVKGSRDGGEEADEDAPALELRPLLPTKMRVIVHPQNGVERYIYRPNMTDIDIDPKDVIHLKLVDPRSETKGVGPVLPAWLTARVDQEALRWNAGFFKRGATPGVVLETPEKIPSAERTRIVAEFDEKFGGTDKAHKTACLPYGLKATPFGQTMREMQFRELRKMTREEIGSILKTPPVLLGLLDGSSYSNAFLQLQIYRDFRVLGRLRYIHAMLTRALAPRYEDGEMLYIEPDVSEMRLPDEEDRELTRAVQLVQAGIVDVSEARAMIGLAEKEADEESVATGTIFAYDQENAVLTIDEIRGTKNMPPHPNREFGPLTVPELKAKHPEMFAPAAPAGGPPGGPPGFAKRAPLVAGHLARGTGRTWLSRLAKTAPHLLAGSVDVQKRRRAFAAGGDSARQPASGTKPTRRAEFQKEDGSAGKDDEEGHAVPLTPWRMAKARDKSVARNEPAVTKIMAAWLARVKAKALALVRRKVGKADEADAVDMVLGKARGDESAKRVDITEEELREVLAEPLTRALQDALRRGLEDGGQDAADGIGVAFGLPNEDVSTYLSDRETNLESVLNEDTAAMVKDVLRAGYEDGDSPVELIERIAESGAFTQARAQRIARTELHAAHGAGAIAQARAAGVTRKRWIASPDEATRESHREMSGQVVGIDEPFVTPDGEELDHPGDPDGSAAEVINCFPRGTLVVTKRGDVRIEDVIIGDSVLTHRNRWRGVVERHVNRSGARLVDVRLQNGRAFRITPAHKLYVVGKGWVDAGALQRGDELLDPVSLVEIHDSVGEVEHPHPELREVEMADRAKNARTSEHFDSGVEVRKEEVDVVVDPLLTDAPTLRAHRADVNEILLLNDGDSEFLEPLTHDDLAGADFSAVGEPSSARCEILDGSLGCLVPASVGVNPLGCDGLASVADGDVEEAKNLGQRAGFVESEFLEQVSEGSLLVDVSPAEVGFKGLPKASLPRRHRVDQGVSEEAFPRAEAEGSGSRRKDVELLSAPNTRHDSHTALHSNVVESVRQAPGSHIVYNLGVEEDMSYFAAGVLGRNCRCVSTYERSSEPSADDLDSLTDPIEGDDDAAVEQARDAVRGLPDDVLSRVDARAMSGLTVERGRGRDVEYDGEKRTLTVGPKAKPRAVQDGVKEHLVNTVTTATDARGFHNARRLSELPDVGGKEDGPGTERERAVALVSRAATGDREGLESVVGRALTDDEHARFRVLAANFWAGFGVKGGKPERRESDKPKRKAEART